MIPFAFSTSVDYSRLHRDPVARELLIDADRAFFARRGIDLEDYADVTAGLTKTPYEKSTGTPPEAYPNYTDSDLDQHTTLDTGDPDEARMS